MSLAAGSLICGVCTLLLLIFALIWGGGQLSQTVKNQGDRLHTHDVDLADHSKRIEAAEKDIYGLTMWHQGAEFARKQLEAKEQR
jgi:hypothetical protein